MSHCQPAILESPVPPQARHLFFSLTSVGRPEEALDRLIPLVDGQSVVVGIGAPLVDALGCHVDGLRAFPCFGEVSVDIPQTQEALWCWLRGSDRGELLHLTRRIEAALSPALSLLPMGSK